MSKEIWKPIPGYEDYYEVSTLGRVKRIKGKKGTHIGRILEGTLHNGYLTVELSSEDEAKVYRINRLVARTFIPNPENKPEVNHINGIKTDNRVENLEWVTHNENIQHAWKTGLICMTVAQRKKISEVNTGRHHSEATISKLREAQKRRDYSEEDKRKLFHSKKIIRVEDGKVFNSICKAAQFCGLKSNSGISLCLTGKMKTAGGYHWKYLNLEDPD